MKHQRNQDLKILQSACLYSSKISRSWKTKGEELFQLKEIKQPWQLNAIILDYILNWEKDSAIREIIGIIDKILI